MHRVSLLDERALMLADGTSGSGGMPVSAGALNRDAVEEALRAAAAAAFPADAVYGLILASSWATEEATVRTSGDGLADVPSDVDIYVITRRVVPYGGRRMQDEFSRHLPGLTLDCHVAPVQRLGRLRPTFGSAAVRTTGRVLIGDPAIVDGFPDPAAIPATEMWRLQLNRAVELTEAFSQGPGHAKFDPPYAATKALADLSYALLWPEARFLVSYRERMGEVTRRLERADDAAARALLTDCRDGLRWKLGDTTVTQEPELLYRRARSGLLHTLEPLWEDARRRRAVFGGALRAWARVLRNGALGPRALRRVRMRHLFFSPRERAYRLIVLALEAAPSSAAYAERSFEYARALQRLFPFRDAARSGEDELSALVELPLRFYRADVRKDEGVR